MIRSKHRSGAGSHDPVASLSGYVEAFAFAFASVLRGAPLSLVRPDAQSGCGCLARGPGGVRLGASDKSASHYPPPYFHTYLRDNVALQQRSGLKSTSVFRGITCVRA